MTDPRQPAVPTSPGLYVDAAGEIWRVRPALEAVPSLTFDELIDQALTQPEALAARSGPFVPLLPLTVRKQDLLLEALAELHHSLSGHGTRYSDQLAELEKLSDEIEALG